MSKIPLSVLIPIKNEAANLPRCLASVAWADEIFVVDSQSTDDSQQIAESFGAKVFQFNFSGTWPKKKTWALKNLPFSHEWVFILDADEVLPASAQAEFEPIVTNSEPAAGQPVGFWINRRFNFMGKWLKHAYFPNWNLRLFLRKAGEFEKLTERETASGDNEVHEHIVVKGETALLRSVMDHYAFPSVDAFIEKHNRYSNWEAVVALERNALNRVGQQKRIPGLRRQLREASRHLPFRPLLRFLYIYLWQKAYLDGMEGYYFARLHAIYEFLIVAKTYELKRRSMSELP